MGQTYLSSSLIVDAIVDATVQSGAVCMMQYGALCCSACYLSFTIVNNTQHKQAHPLWVRLFVTSAVALNTLPNTATHCNTVRTKHQLFLFSELFTSGVGSATQDSGRV